MAIYFMTQLTYSVGTIPAGVVMRWTPDKEEQQIRAGNAVRLPDDWEEAMRMAADLDERLEAKGIDLLPYESRWVYRDEWGEDDMWDMFVTTEVAGHRKGDIIKVTEIEARAWEQSGMGFCPDRVFYSQYRHAAE